MHKGDGSLTPRFSPFYTWTDFRGAGQPNLAPWQALDPPKTLTKPEFTFQLSFKAKVWQDIFGKDVDLWVAYTQRSFWQLYNFSDSSPFRETNEVWAYYFLKKYRFAVMVRDNLDFGGNKGAIQVEWSFPLFAMIGGHVQYYLGYGESLLDYNRKVNRIGVGFILADWY